MKTIEHKNEKSQYHGYQEWYWTASYNNGLWFRGNYKHDLEIGYNEWNPNGLIGDEGTIVEFHIK